MYSYDDRIRAVKLYIKLDKRIAATLIQLGYPTKNALKTWYREYEQRQDVSLGYARSPLATSNSPTFGRSNSPRQDGLIINQ